MINKKENLVGLKFGRLIVLEEFEKTTYGAVQWKCKCECGNECLAITANLKKGSKKKLWMS